MSKTANNNVLGEEVDDDGLTAAELEYGATPMSQMTPDQRTTAMMIREKRDNARWAANAAARGEKKKREY